MKHDACPKCGQATGRIQWHQDAFGQHYSCIGGYRAEVFCNKEHLHYHCGCGYEWVASTKDASGKELFFVHKILGEDSDSVADRLDKGVDIFSTKRPLESLVVDEGQEDIMPSKDHYAPEDNVVYCMECRKQMEYVGTIETIPGIDEYECDCGWRAELAWRQPRQSPK